MAILQQWHTNDIRLCSWLFHYTSTFQYLVKLYPLFQTSKEINTTNGMKSRNCQCKQCLLIFTFVEIWKQLSCYKLNMNCFTITHSFSYFDERKSQEIILICPLKWLTSLSRSDISWHFWLICSCKSISWELRCSNLPSSEELWESLLVSSRFSSNICPDSFDLSASRRLIIASDSCALLVSVWVQIETSAYWLEL